MFQPILQKLGIHYVGDMPLLNNLAQDFCRGYPAILICQSLTFPFVGLAQEQIKPVSNIYNITESRYLNIRYTECLRYYWNPWKR